MNATIYTVHCSRPREKSNRIDMMRIRVLVDNDSPAPATSAAFAAVVPNGYKIDDVTTDSTLIGCRWLQLSKDFFTGVR